MIKNLLYLIFLGLIIWGVYVSFFGNSKEIQLRNKLLNTGKEFGQSVVDVFQNEKEKIEDGNYDKVLSKLDDAIDNLKQADKDNGKFNSEIKEIEDQKTALKNNINENQENSNSDENEKKIKKLAEDIIKLSEKMGK
jgi:peptidoglycan hydrolase CwlO-like protein